MVHIPKNHIKQDVWPSNWCAYVVSPKKLGEPWCIWIGWTVADASTRVSLLNCRMNRLRFADEMVLHAWTFSTGSSARIWSVFCCVQPSRNEKQHYKDWGIISCPRQCFLRRRPRQCFLQVSEKTLQQVETFKHLGMVFTSDGCRNKLIDGRIGKANAVLRELYGTVVAKREISKNAKLSVLKSVFVPILTCGHKFWVTAERIVSKE